MKLQLRIASVIDMICYFHVQYTLLAPRQKYCCAIHISEPSVVYITLSTAVQLWLKTANQQRRALKQLRLFIAFYCCIVFTAKLNGLDCAQGHDGTSCMTNAYTYGTFSSLRFSGILSMWRLAHDESNRTFLKLSDNLRDVLTWTHSKQSSTFRTAFGVLASV